MNSTKFTAASIKDRVTELQKESEICSGKDGFWEEFEVMIHILKGREKFSLSLFLSLAVIFIF